MSSLSVIPLAPRAIWDADVGRSRLGALLWRGLLFCSLFSVTFAPEFSREGDSTAGSFLYLKAAGHFRYIDLAILAVFLLHVLCLGCLRRTRISFPQSLAIPGLAFLACIAAAIGYGISRHGENFFFDWRGLALGIAFYVVSAFWLQNSDDVTLAIRVFAIHAGIRIGLLYVLYAAGYGDTLFGSPIPIFDGPVLSCIVFAALLALSHQNTNLSRQWRFAAAALAIAASLMVLLCMRRTYWAELGIGLFVLLLLRDRHRLRNLCIIVVALVMAAIPLGDRFSNRLQSFDVTRADAQFSSDNADHLYDLLDAWEQVRQSPIMGIGLGTAYPTRHIRNWKPESVMVHNAPLHVWLKYGLAGVGCYVWFHIALLIWLFRLRVRTSGVHHSFVTAAFAYFAAQFIVTLGFAPWPYSELQLTVLMSFILAAAVAISRQTQRVSCL